MPEKINAYPRNAISLASSSIKSLKTKPTKPIGTTESAIHILFELMSKFSCEKLE